MYPHILTPETKSRVEALLASAQHIVITAHRSPDGDALGSSLALYEYLTATGREARVILPNPFPDFLRATPNARLVTFYEGNEEECTKALLEADMIAMLDFGELPRLGDMAEAVRRSPAARLCIDHHLAPDTDVADVLISRPEACSTCELVFLLLHELGGLERITVDGATALYTGMMTDTGAFTYNSTSPHIYHIIGRLLETGMDKDRIYRSVFHNFSTSRLRFTGYILSRKLRFYHRSRASVLTITRKEMERFHFIRGDAEGLVNQPLQVRGMRLSISLREDTDRDIIRVSLRSVDDFPANEMAAKFFNGGGHFNAAGGELPFPMEEAIRTAERAIEAFADKL